MLRICRRHRRLSSQSSKRKELERTTDIFLTDATMDNEDSQGYEACLTDPKGQKFVGTTAKFDDQWGIIALRPELRLEGIDPEFEKRRESLVWAAQSTCNIGVKRHVASHGEFACGTAFFVGPTKLLTAGHVVNDSRDKIIAELPGALHATYFVEDLFQQPQPETSQRFECKLVQTLFGKVDHADVSILEVVGSYKSDTFIEVKQQVLPAECDGAVDILGYPGDYSARYVREMHPASQLVDGNMIHDVEALFPKRELVITHGSVNQGGHLPQYQVSTVRGMSGGPVIMNGKVIGIHTGTQAYANYNRCISFEWDIIWNLLRKCAENSITGKGEEHSSKRMWNWIKRESDTFGEAGDEKTNSRTQVRHKTHRMTKSVPSILPN